MRFGSEVSLDGGRVIVGLLGLCLEAGRFASSGNEVCIGGACKWEGEMGAMDGNGCFHGRCAAGPSPVTCQCQ